jgi:hypothetical protein
MSFGPRKGNEADREPAMVDRDAAASMAHQFYLDGQQSVMAGGYQAGCDLGHDVGLGARNDHARPFVVGVMQGHAAGLEERHQLIELALETARPGAAVGDGGRSRMNDTHVQATWPERQAAIVAEGEPEVWAEQEAEAG